nr:hypothetical protein [Kiritimatiellia bacterium]
GLGVEIDPLSGAATVSPINAPNAKLLPGTWLNGGDRSYKVFDGGEIPTGNASRPSYWHGLSLSDDTITFSLRWYQWDASDDYVLMWIATYEAPISWADWVPDDDGHLEETKAATFVEKTFERSSSTPVLNKEPSSSVTFEALTGEPSEEAAEGVSTARGFSWSFSQLAPSEFLITPSASTITKDWFSGTGSAYPKFKVFASLNPASYVREGPDLSELQDSDPQSDWSGRIMGWMIVWQLDESEEEGEEGQDGEMGVHMLRLRANAVFNGFEAKCTIKAVSQWGVDISENGLVTFNVFEGSVLDPDPTLPVEIPNELSGNGGYNEEFDFYHYNVWAEGSITLTPATS